MRVLAFISLFLFASAANALCAFSYPSCTRCLSFTQQGDKSNGGGCGACSGFCQPFLVASSSATAELEAQGIVTKEGVMYVNPKNSDKNSGLLTIDPAKLYAIAQVNPMASLAILNMTKEYHTGTLGVLGGEIAYGDIPSAETVTLTTQKAADTELDRSRRKLSQDNTYARVKWSAVASPNGVKVTFDAQEVDAQGVVLKTLYPSIIADVKRVGTAGNLEHWQTAQ
jgi:hypothetical protein